MSKLEDRSRIKVAILTTDARECWREYDKKEPYFGTAPEALLQGVPSFPDVEMHVVSCWQKPMTAPKKLADNIWFHGLHVPKVGWMRTAYQGCIRAARKKLKEIQPDIVHGQGTERDCAICAALSGFPNVVTIHGNMGAISRLNRARPFSFGWLAARLERWTLPRTDGVVCITRYTQDEVRSLARRTWVLPNAVDGGFFSIKNNPVTPPQIVCIGHIQPRKNQVRLIEALDPVAKRIPLTLRIYGKTEDNDPFSMRFLELVRQRPWCYHGGFADRTTIKTALQTATVLVLPSLEENCPMSVLEAMAAGVPVVAARAGGIPELFEDGVTGLFCDPLKAESIGGAVERLLKNPDLACEIGSRARKHARDRFHPDVIVQKTLDIYREVLSTRS